MKKEIEEKVQEYEKRLGKTMNVLRAGKTGPAKKVKVKTRDFVLPRIVERQP